METEGLIHGKPEKRLDKTYWNQKWEKGETGWDTGQPSAALVDYVLENLHLDARILIPGCGSAYEAEALLKSGYRRITVLDIAPLAVEKLKKKFKDQPRIKVLLGDFFIHTGQYDLILEQTFFCALDPALRPAYVEKAAELLCGKGRLAGLLFNRSFDAPGPPFGGESAEYRALFSPRFTIGVLENCKNSIPARRGTELFIEMQKRD